jgi:hypothetical protein
MQMASLLSKAPKWSVTVHTSYDTVQRDGSKVEWNGVRTVTLSRPDKLRVESNGAAELVPWSSSTAKKITTFDESAKVYAQASHPGTVDDAVVYFVHDPWIAKDSRGLKDAGPSYRGLHQFVAPKGHTGD